MKASHCDQCKHGTLKYYSYRGSAPFPVLICAKHHSPRFYKPGLNPHYQGWGWKRVCADCLEARPITTMDECRKCIAATNAFTVCVAAFIKPATDKESDK